ncbi:MAG: ribosome-associated translation inhibitor RaiA [Gemmatimonadota bacterium]|jgi:ribosomal subunit interface protein
MDVRMTTRHVDLSDTFRKLAEERVQKLGKYEPRLIAVDLIFEDDHGRFTTEARADVPGRPPLVARTAADGRRKSLDQTLRKLSRQLRRERSKLTEHQAPPVAVLPKE